TDREPKLRRFSEELAGHIDGCLEALPKEEVSLLFAEWVMGTAEASKADELFGSLGLAQTSRAGNLGGTARKRAYAAMFGALVLAERSRGAPLADIDRRR